MLTTNLETLGFDDVDASSESILSENIFRKLFGKKKQAEKEAEKQAEKEAEKQAEKEAKKEGILNKLKGKLEDDSYKYGGLGAILGGILMSPVARKSYLKCVKSGAPKTKCFIRAAGMVGAGLVGGGAVGGLAGYHKQKKSK
ncbi:MAG: hypothetical protein QW303_07850 [Nitrososphaerota archaeon]